MLEGEGLRKSKRRFGGDLDDHWLASHDHQSKVQRSVQKAGKDLRMSLPGKERKSRGGGVEKRVVRLERKGPPIPED